MIKLKSLIREVVDTDTWYHGSPSGNLRGGTSGLHLGTYLAAKTALEARIGIPVEGKWDGTREYGKTLLCGKNTLKKRKISPTGFNMNIPIDDFYPDQSNLPTYSGGNHMTLSNRPAIKSYKIICAMSNTNTNPYEDFKANGYMRALLKRGIAKRGFYYKNESEDYGSISAVVPSGRCIKEV
jgi:hypothetical protein